MIQKLSNEIICHVIKSSNVLHKSIISFMFTTGLSHDKLRDLKIEDLLNACRDFMSSNECIDDLLKKDSVNIIPCWEISKKSTVGMCFNTPETTQYLFDYLKDRKKYVILTDDSYLFKNYIKNNTPIVDEEPLIKILLTEYCMIKK